MEIHTVPAANIAAMAASLLLCFGLPAGICICLKKQGASLKSFFIGCATFVVFALVLEQILHAFMLRYFADFFDAHIVAYAIYGGLAAGVFEETGRYFAMRFLMKKRLNKTNALMYGAGHGGVEAVLIGGVSNISNISVSVMINAGNAEALAQAGESAAQFSQLGALPAWMFLMGGLERVSAVILHICLSYFVYRAVKERRPGFFALAVFLHFAFDTLTVLAAARGLNVLLLELLLLAAGMLLALSVRTMYTAEDAPPEDVKQA